MTEAEADRVLGLAPGASIEEVRAAYRRLMKRVHPDLGGSGALAAMLNAAKEVLRPGVSGFGGRLRADLALQVAAQLPFVEKDREPADAGDGGGHDGRVISRCVVTGQVSEQRRAEM